nr:hypothetical protein LTR18_002297 [Exophiala xenobiotica]
MFETEHGRWQAVQTRSKSADSAFVYAVTTTRIFCRPTCPARLARRANVKFYDTSIKAIAGGFRPCKRCKPDQVHLEGSVITKPQKEIVKRACDYVIKSNGNTTLKEIAQNVGISARYLHGIFKDMTGLTPAVYAARIKSEGLEGGSSEEATSQQQSPQSFGIITNSSLCETDWATGQYEDSDVLQADADTNLDFYTSVASYEAAEEQLRSLETQNDLLWNSGDQASTWQLGFSSDEQSDLSMGDDYFGPYMPEVQQQQQLGGEQGIGVVKGMLDISAFHWTDIDDWSCIIST